MEIINKDKAGSPEVSATAKKSNTYTILGIILIAIGALWLMFNFGIVSERFFDHLFSWQSLVTVIGIVLLATRNWISGGVVTAAGVFCLVIDILNVEISFTKVILPALVVALGIACLFARHEGAQQPKA